MKFKLVAALFLCLSVFFNANAQDGAHIVILWDVTGSLLPKQPGMKDLDGTDLKTYSDGNGLWVELKKAIIECIEYVEDDPSNEITIIAFQDDIRTVETQKASSAGKEYLVEFVTKYKYIPHKNTNIVAPIKKFYTYLRGDKIKYMFLFTDGENDHQGTKPELVPTINSWINLTRGKNAYGFYVLVHQDADKPYIRDAIENQPHFWIVPDAKVRIKTATLPTYLKYNVRDDKGAKTIELKGYNCKDAKGTLRLVYDDQYYEVLCSDRDIRDEKIAFEVRCKEGITPPIKHTIKLSPKLEGHDSYTFVGPDAIFCEVVNIPERSLSLDIKDKNFGEASYYGSFGKISEEAYTPAESNIKVNFSEQAKVDGSSAIMKVYLVNKAGEGMLNLSSQNFKLFINGDEIKGDSFKITPDVTNLKLSIIGHDMSQEGKYYGRIELIPSKLDNCLINGSPDVFRWNFRFEERWNPIKLGLTCILGLLVVALLLWFTVLRPVFFPRFGAIQKTLSARGLAPVIIRFRGVRMVVIAANHQKKQSWVDRALKGKILYVTHSAFATPMIFKPSRGGCILAVSQGGAYWINPNPMPQIGASTITEIKSNTIININ
ncbi:MAG: VWA domain-containing protein [Alistipes sp.]|nr:VWA domain-containing protein [Alistipes sp.]